MTFNSSVLICATHYCTKTETGDETDLQVLKEPKATIACFVVSGAISQDSTDGPSRMPLGRTRLVQTGSGSANERSTV